MKFDIIQSNFTAGELSPKLKGRVDLEKYLAGLAVCENMIVLPSGGVSKRGGFRYVAEVKNSAKTTTLIAFRYNDLYSYILEFGENYIRVYFENEQIGSPYEITTTYLENEVTDIRVTQDATNLYIVHKNHAPAILTRTAHDAWSLSDITFSFDYAYGDYWESAGTVELLSSYAKWMSICWSPELSLFCAVSRDYTRVATSPDGVIWTLQTAINKVWYSVCWSSDLSLFVAVGYSGATDGVMTSPDGVVWTLRTSANNSWQSVCWSSDLTLFVAVSSSGTGDRVMTSPDGVTWTPRTSAADNSWQSVCWSSDLTLLVAVSADGTSNRVMTSPDGVTWTIRVTPGSLSIMAICWSTDLTLFVAVGSGSEALISSDGVAWATNPADWGVVNDVCWSPKLGLFIAVSSSAGDRTRTSPDGVIWTTHSAPYDSSYHGVCWSSEKEKAIAVSSTYNAPYVVMHSFDGVTWETPTESAWQSICWSPELSVFCAVSSSSFSGGGSGVTLSSDGEIWELQAPAAGNDWQSVCWSPLRELFCAVSDTGTNSRIMTSPKGATWSLVPEIGQTADNDWRSMCWSPELSIFCAVSSSGTGDRVMTSPDGEVWASAASPADNDWRSVCWSSGLTLFVAVSSSGTGNRVMTSPDGVTWTLRISAADNDWMSVCWSGSLFVAVAKTGTGDRVMTSSDGVTWATQVSSIDNTWSSVCWSPDLSLFVAVSSTVSTTNVMTSPDGAAWTTRTSGLNSKWESICWHSTLLIFVAVASAGVARGMYSSDGVTWKKSDAGEWWASDESPYGMFMVDFILGVASLYAVCEYEGKFVAIGEGFPFFTTQRFFAWTSVDGINWTGNPVTVYNSWRTICAAPELPLVAALSITGEGNRVIVSEDAVSWATWEFETQTNEWSSVCWSPKLRIFVAVSKTGDKRVGVSSNGRSWWFYEAAALNMWQSVCWSPETELFVAVASSGSGNRVMTSPDGEVWTSRTSAIDNPWQSVCWSSSLYLFCAVASSGTSDRVMTSPDGVVWTIRTSVTNNAWYSVCWGEEVKKFVAVASSGTLDRIMTSSDGVIWESGENPIDNNWKSVCWSPELKRFVAVADTGAEKRVMYSVTTYESWSSFDEYPSLVWFYEQRLFFAATTENPNMIWGSKSADFYNMSIGEGLDNDAIKLDVKAAYNFLWVSAGEEILIGGSNAEFSLSANALNEALTPMNVRPALRTKFGGTSVPPIRVDDSVLFMQQGFRKLRRLVSSSQVGGYSDRYKASDITLLSDHITESGVIGAVRQTVKDTIVWACRDDGVLIGLTYEPEHNIFGWHTHKIGGTNAEVQSLAVAEVVATSGSHMQDEVWAIISRTINGSTKKYIEYMREGLPDEEPIENSFFIDSGVTNTGTGITVINDLDHLEGEIVSVIGDGIEQSSKVVSSGTITIDTAADKVHVGLPFTSIIETLPLEGGNPVGTSQGLIKRINSITLRLYRSLGVDVGDTNGNMDACPFDSADLFTGDTEPVPFAGCHDRQARVRLSSSSLLPLNLLSIMLQARTK